MSFSAALSVATIVSAQHVVPGQVLPSWPQTYDMKKSTAIMICNNSGPVNPLWASAWGLVDLDWNSDKVDWSKPKPMDCEENMVRNVAAMKAINPDIITWVYRNGIKALPWHTSVRTKLEDRAYWGWFMPLANCSPAPGVYTCGSDATHNLYHDFEQTPSGDCGVGVECGEYVFNHRNSSLLSDFLLGEYFFGVNGANNSAVQGFYVDDDWSASGPSEMDKDAVAKMGMSPADVAAMIVAWSANVQAWRDALVAAGKFEWFLFYGGQQTAPGQNQTCGQCTCQKYLETNCGAGSPSQNGTLFYGFSRITHHQAWPLPSPQQDLAAFLLSRGPYAYFGYGWTGCADEAHPFTRPAALDADYGEPTSFCTQTAPGVWEREYTKAHVALNCTSWEATITPK